MKVLVTGAAGYIGSVVTEQLLARNHEVFALDNLRYGHYGAVHQEANFLQGDLLNREWLISLLAENPVDAVVHLAAEAQIDESMRDPGRFFLVNVHGGLNLLDAMMKADIHRMVFSSTAAVYGEQVKTPIAEEAGMAPINAYGESKLAFERMLYWYRMAHGLRYVTLRYFNASGATDSCGECHVPETHLIPILLEVAQGQREAVQLYGTDYGTPDGTCIRDYVHVVDIAEAHLLALSQIDHIESRTYNIGSGTGHSNLEVIQAVSQVTEKDIPVTPAARRPGDPERLVASSDLIRKELGWEPLFPQLAEIVQSAWQWKCR